MATGTTRRKTRRRAPAPEPGCDSRPSPAWGPGWGRSGPTQTELKREQLWQTLIGEGWRAEIIRGRIVVSPWTKRRHAQLVHRVQMQLFELALDKGWEFYQTWAVHIPPHRGDKRLPDLLVAPPDSPEFDENQAYGHGTLLVVEITSSDNRTDDLQVKPAEYARAGIPIMLIVDEFSDPRSVTLLSDPRDGEYRSMAKVDEGEPVKLPEPFGVVLDTGLIFR
ncbi:Uma2 family endonuclease [Nonomuraea sp. NPDC050680]|uniref:Uma2 family endonuclease n=1 Tax=Nonomuraea sp. NPDC050680 TaxID=3154630 RepID=UPI0033CE4A1A